ncbi:MAG: 2-oxoacid:ferredoxin oxidoreductase subunit beta [Tissierellia bacterium]|nr:2-oxoacid:ferredoxin oxidoreductase subunit beta [Tissierellia bacterium]
MSDRSQLVDKYFRVDNLPHIWCPGCSHGIVTRALTKAIDELDLDPDKIVIVSGIGCSSRAAGYLNFNTLHTTHGRAIAYATGIKLANPELHVIVITGDGDASAIGGNHLIHACRRNIDLTVMIFNNNIYGMTGGQYSPTTPHTALGTTAPYGNIDRPFDLVRLVEGAGATYIARGTAYHTLQLTGYMKKAIAHKGLSVVEAISSCPTYYGRKNRIGDAVGMMQWMKDTFVEKRAYDRLDEEKRIGKVPFGEFVNIQAPEYTAVLAEITKRVEGRL